MTQPHDQYAKPDDKAIQNALENVITPLEAFYQRVEERGNNICFVQPLADGSVVEYSWTEVNNQVRRVAAYLRSLELPPGSHIALISKNCAQWIITDVAIWLAGHVSVPLYPTLTAESVRKIVKHSEAKAIFIGPLEGWESMSAGVSDNVIRITLPDSPAGAKPDSTLWSDILKDVEPLADSPAPEPDTLATIVYTSGTTGAPKGVMHSFRTLANSAQLARLVYTSDHNERLFSYLPLSHVAERNSVQNVQLYNGCTIYFNHSLETFVQDLQRAAPTIFFAVPRIWMKFQQQVFAKLPKEQLDAMLEDPEQAGPVSRMILEQLGLHEIRVALSGAAPLSTSLIDWYARLGLEITECYGMSENMGYSHANPLGGSSPGSVGIANPATDCKIADTGEVLVRSATNMLGYYKEPEMTRETIDAEGYVHTGDKGEVDANGYLKITGRIKEIFKTSKGKYVAPAPIENLLLRNPQIEQVCVTGASLTQPLALINLSESARAKLNDATERKALGEEFQKLLEDTNARLDKHENLQCLVLVADVWSIENGYLTPTLKLKRQKLDDNYGTHYEQWCTQKSAVVIA